MPFNLIVPRGSLIIFVTILVLTIGGSFAWTYLPSAVLEIYPATETRSVEQTVILSKENQEPDFVRFILPARLIEKEIEEKKQFTRDSAEVYEDFATGTVTLVNDQDTSQPLLPQTHLKHESTGIYVLTNTSVTIPPKSEATIQVTAKEKGESGNLEAGKFIIDRLPPHLQKTVYGISSEPLSGGVATNNPLTQTEIDEAIKEITEKARERALGEMTAAAGGVVLNPDLTSIDVVLESVSAQAGSHTNVFTVKTQIAARGFIVDENDLLRLTLLSLRQSAGDNEEFINYQPESFKMEITRADYAAGTAQIKGSLSGSFARKIGLTVLSSENLAGLSVAEAQEHFKQFDNVAEVDVALSPFWVKTIPAKEGSVDIIIKSGQKQNSD